MRCLARLTARWGAYNVVGAGMNKSTCSSDYGGGCSSCDYRNSDHNSDYCSSLGDVFGALNHARETTL